MPDEKAETRNGEGFWPVQFLAGLFCLVRWLCEGRRHRDAKKELLRRIKQRMVPSPVEGDEEELP